MERKEAIEVVKKNWPDSSFTMLREALETLIPELAESEGEKIRKELIDYFSSTHATDTFRGISWDRVVAWLEKQQDGQKPEWSKEIQEEFERKYNEGKAAGIELAKLNVKWSEEDESCLITIINELEASKSVSKYETKTYEKLISWLKSLRPQKQWKPSDEHYELEEFAKIVRGNLTGISKAVQKLFEAKYLQLTGNKMCGGFKD